MRNPHKKPTAEQKKQWDANYYQKNKDKVQAQHKAYRDAHVEETRQMNAKSYYKDHERTLKVRGLARCKRIFKAQVEKLTPIFDQKEITFDAKIKADLLSMLNAELKLNEIDCEQNDSMPEIGLMALGGEVHETSWKDIVQDDFLMQKIKLYVLMADPEAYNNLKIN
jgi:hypothetical protein